MKVKQGWLSLVQCLPPLMVLRGRRLQGTWESNVEVGKIARLSPVCVLSSLPRPGSRDVDCVGTRERPPPDGKQQCVTPSPVWLLVPLLPPEDTMTLSKVPCEGLWPGYIWEAIPFHLDCFMLTRFHDCMIIGNESDPMNFLILLIETRPCNFIDLESLLNNAIFALKNWTQTDLVL